MTREEAGAQMADLCRQRGIPASFSFFDRSMGYPEIVVMAVGHTMRLRVAPNATGDQLRAFAGDAVRKFEAEWDRIERENLELK